MGLGVSGHADVEVDDLLGDEADVEGHLTVLHGQGPLAVIGLVGMEHGAVGVKVGGVDAVGQSGLCRRFGRANLWFSFMMIYLEVSILQKRL